MTDTRSVWERELRIEDSNRKTLRARIDPLIHSTLQATGYTEDRIADGRIELDSTTVMPSDAYKDTLRIPFDALGIMTRYDVSDDGSELTKANATLHTVGGFVSAKLVAVGSRYFYSVSSQKDQSRNPPLNRIAENPFRDILEDVRAHTELGYSQADQSQDVAKTFQDFEGLSMSRFIDRRAHLQLLSDAEHGDIQANIGESFEEKSVLVGNKLKKRRRSRGKIFELTTKQPFGDASASMGIIYRSGTNGSTEMKLSTSIDDETIPDADKAAYYEEAIRTFQDPRYTRFGDAVIRNLNILNDPNSDFVRIG